MAPNKSELSYLYRSESEPKVKERLLLVLKVKGNGVIPARAAKELDRSRTWSTNWLMRYDQEGVHGLKNKPRSGRLPKLSKDCFRNKKRTFCKQAWMDYKTG